MLKFINTVIIAPLAFAALAGTVHAETSKKTVDDRAAEVKAAAKRYGVDRAEHARDMIGLLKGDYEGVLFRRASGPDYKRKAEQEQIDTELRTHFKKEVIFSIERVPEDTLRDVGLAYDFRASKTHFTDWVFNERTPQDFIAKYGEPAYTVFRENSLCTDHTQSRLSYYDGDVTEATYVDINKDGQNVEIHVSFCKYTEGPDKGKSILTKISPPMKGVNFIERYAKQERRVLNSTIGNGKKF